LLKSVEHRHELVFGDDEIPGECCSRALGQKRDPAPERESGKYLHLSD
jgi:hypothetical protein